MRTAGGSSFLLVGSRVFCVLCVAHFAKWGWAPNGPGVCMCSNARVSISLVQSRPRAPFDPLSLFLPQGAWLAMPRILPKDKRQWQTDCTHVRNKMALALFGMQWVALFC